MSKSKAQKGGARRRQVPDVDEEHLLDTCLSHVQKAGVCASFCLGAYFHLESSNAVRGSALGEVQHVIRDLLKVSPTLEFKYSTLKSVFGEVLKQFPGLKERFPVSQQGNAAKAFADGILVVCNHARRIGRDEGRLAEACSKLTSIRAAKLEEIASWLKAPKSGAGSVIAATPKKKVKKEEKKQREGVSPGTAAALEEYQIPATQDQESEGESLLASAKKAEPIPVRKGLLKAEVAKKRPAAKGTCKKPAAASAPVPTGKLGDDETVAQPLILMPYNKVMSCAVRIKGGRQILQVKSSTLEHSKKLARDLKKMLENGKTVGEVKAYKEKKLNK